MFAAFSDFGSYFRTLHHLVWLIDESDVPNKHRYASLMRAQLSNAEIALLLIDGLSSIGRPQFKPLIEKYGLLEPVRMLAHMERFRSYYAASAFGQGQRSEPRVP